MLWSSLTTVHVYNRFAEVRNTLNPCQKQKLTTEVSWAIPGILKFQGLGISIANCVGKAILLALVYFLSWRPMCALVLSFHLPHGSKGYCRLINFRVKIPSKRPAFCEIGIHWIILESNWTCKVVVKFVIYIVTVCTFERKNYQQCFKRLLLY